MVHPPTPVEEDLQQMAMTDGPALDPHSTSGAQRFTIARRHRGQQPRTAADP